MAIFRYCALSLSLLAACATAPNVGDPPAAPFPDAALGVSQIIEFEHARAASISDGDVFTLERLLGDGYRGFSWEGERRNKSQEVQHLRAAASQPRLTLTLAADELEVNNYGAAAVVTGRGSMEQTRLSGREFRMVRFTHLWLWRDGRWQLVASHESPVATPPR